MIDLNDLPPRRELPPAVRAQARQRLTAQLADRPARAAGVGIAVAAVAVVATLVGVSLVTGNTGRQAAAPKPRQSTFNFDTIPDARYDLRESATVEDADRCRAGDWKPLFTVSSGGVTLITFQSGGKVRFCELTPETVALSAPATRPAYGAKITYVSATGTVAGVVGSNEKFLAVSDDALTDVPMVPAQIHDGVFVAPNGVSAHPRSLKLLLGQDPTPAPHTSVPPLVTPRTDRPQSSPGGTFLCDDRGDVTPLVDRHAWKPAASAVTLTAIERVQTARYGKLLAYCMINDRTKVATLVVTDGGSPVDPTNGREATPNPYVITYGSFYHFTQDNQGMVGSSTQVICGLALDARTTTVRLIGTKVEPITARVVDGMFVLPNVDSTLEYDLASYAKDGTLLGVATLGR